MTTVGLIGSGNIGITVAQLDGNALTSSELLLRYIPDAMLVKAFNNIYYKHLFSLARPAGAADRLAEPVPSSGRRGVIWPSLASRRHGSRPGSSAVIAGLPGR
jgi:predicted dinucleotide-binding enzyme